MQATPTPLPGPGPGRYRFVDHRDDLDGLLTALGVIADVVIVGHDRSGMLGIDWARPHPDAVRGIAYRETLVSPVSRHGENAPDPELVRVLRSDADERLVLRDSVFVETVLPAGTQRARRQQDRQVGVAPNDRRPAGAYRRATVKMSPGRCFRSCPSPFVSERCPVVISPCWSAASCWVWCCSPTAGKSS